MSKARRHSDFERTMTMLDLVRSRYPGERAMSLSHVVVEEVAPGTGWSADQRYADVLALSVWPSKGLTLDGYEIKASKADLKKELADPSKHEAVARYCDAWWLVAWDDSVLVDGIPESWGILTTVEVDGERELKVQRKATPRTPETWPRPFVCSLVRNAFVQSPGAAYVARACVDAGRRGRSEGKRAQKDATYAATRALAAALYGKDSWKWPHEAENVESLLKIATERLTQGELTRVPTEGAP